MSKIWITSDTHFGHQREFLWAPRGFQSSYEHDEAVIRNWNDLVAPEDTVFHLGDVMLNDNAWGIECLERLNGDIKLILGNHDTKAREDFYNHLPNVTVLGHAFPLKYKSHRFFLSHYPTLCSNYDMDEPLKVQTINLCGHSHTPDRFCDIDKGLIYHCELDCHHNSPVLLDDILDELRRFKLA